MPGNTWVSVSVWQTCCRRKEEDVETAGDADRGVPIQASRGGREALAITGNRRRIECIPLGDQGSAEDGVPHLLGGRFPVVKGRLRLEGVEVQTRVGRTPRVASADRGAPRPTGRSECKYGSSMARSRSDYER